MLGGKWIPEYMRMPELASQSQTEIRTRLLKVQVDRFGTLIREVPKQGSMLDSASTFILDVGNELFQWNGTKSNKDERMQVRYSLCFLGILKTI